MINLTFAYIISTLNLVFATVIYLSLHGWFVSKDPSGMQLIWHLVLTAPIVFITTIWFYVLMKKGQCSPLFWKVNICGLLAPIMSMQTGVTYYHFDKVGLLASIVVLIFLSYAFLQVVIKNVHS